MSDELRHIQREIRDWAARPPKTSPPVARTRVLARIEERRRWTGWKTAAAAVVLVVGLASGLFLRGPETPSDPPAVVAAPRSSPALLVYELESGTKLYLALAAPPSGRRHPKETRP